MTTSPPAAVAVTQRETIARICYVPDKHALGGFDKATAFAVTEPRSTTARNVREAYERADKILARFEAETLALARPEMGGEGALAVALEALNAIVDRGPERDVKWAGLTAKDIALHAIHEVAALTNAPAEHPAGEVSLASTLADRKTVNTILADHFSRFIPDIVERVGVGNAACSAILASLSPPAVAQEVRNIAARWSKMLDDCEKHELAGLSVNARNLRTVLATLSPDRSPTGLDAGEVQIAKAIAHAFKSGRAKAFEEAARIADGVARSAANEVHGYDSYGGPTLPGREREVVRRDTADEIVKLLRTAAETPGAEK